MTRKVLWVGLIVLGLTSSCRNSLRDTDNEVITSVEHNLARSTYFDLVNGIHQVLSTQSDVLSLNDSTLVFPICEASISFSTSNSNFPVSFIIDFGIDQLCAEDGHVRTGSLSGIITKNYKSVFAKVNLTVDGYKVDEWAVDGNLQWQNKVVKGDTIIFDMELTEGQIQSDTTNLKWEGDYRMTWYEGIVGAGNNLGLIVTGGAVGRATKGNAFETAISTEPPFIWNLGCHWITQGIEEVTPNNRTPRTNSYGNGTCDAAYTVTIASKEFSLIAQ